MFALAIFSYYVEFSQFFFPGEELVKRTANKEMVNDIEKCIQISQSDLIIYSVVNQSPDSDSETNEAVDFAAQISERLGKEGYRVQAFNRRYEGAAVIFDGVRVWSPTTEPISEVYIGKNSSSGTQVTCIQEQLKLGFDAMDVATKIFDQSSSTNSMDGYFKIGEDSPTSNKTFYFGTAMPEGGSAYPVAGVY